METKNITSAKEAIHKMMPFVKGLSKAPDTTKYVEEISKKLKTVSEGANELVNPAAKELIFQFKDLHGLISKIKEKLEEELRHYNDKKDNPNGLNDWEKQRYDFFNAAYNPLFYFIENIKATPWGSFIKYEHLSSSSLLFSPKEYWPENLQGIHICLRTLLLQKNDVVEPLLTMYSSIEEAHETLAEYYGLAKKTIEGNFTAAHELLKSSPNDLSSQRHKQLMQVKSWLEREGYFEVGKTIKI